MKVPPVVVCQLLMKEYPSVLILPVVSGGYSVAPRYLPDVKEVFYEKAVYLRRALPSLAHSWDVELVKRSQLSLSFER